MSLVTAVAGRYTAAVNFPVATSHAVGLTREGYKISFSPDYDQINETDGYGSSLIEEFMLGLSRVSMDFIGKEWIAGIVDSYNPWNAYALVGSTKFRPGLVSRKATAIGGTIVLTAVTGTPAATLGPATLTAGLIMPSRGFDMSWLYGPKHRESPIRFDLLLYDDDASGAGTFWTAT